jgi:hypothetical protein
MFGVGVGIRVGGRTIVSSGGGFDPDAQAFFDRVTTAGGTLSETEKNATNTLVLNMKTAGIWSAMKAIYPMVGASAAACAQNLKSSSFTGTFTSGWTFASTGVTPNGTSAYMNTTLVPNTSLSINDAHISVYSRTNNPVAGSDIGASDTGGWPGAIFIVQKWSDGNNYPSVHALVNTTGTPYADSRGFFLLRRNNATQIIQSRNGTNETLLQSSTTKTTTAIALGAIRQPTTTVFSNREQAFASIGDGLTDTQASNFYTAVQAFQTTLSRQV